jgi:SAM-dependent methyltransferase
MTISALTGERTVNLSNRAFWGPVDLCPLCGGREFSEFLRAPDPHYGNPGTFPVARCADCGLNFLNPQPTAAYLATAYPEDYYAYHVKVPTTPRERLVKKTKRVLRTLLYFHVNVTADPLFAKPGTMLDLGCGSGWFLAEMRDKGWRVHGVEPGLDAARLGREIYALDIFAGTIEEANYPTFTFDYVRSNHSFEHLNNPRQVLSEIRRVLKPNGKLLIGVPNVEGLAARFFGRYWWYLGAPVHPFGYSPRTLTRLLKEEGFEVERVRFNSTYAGIFGSLQIYVNRKNGRRSEQGWIFRNPVLMLGGHWLACIADLFRCGDCIEVTARRSPDR